MNIVVYDIEHLCWIGKIPKNNEPEIIQIGAALIDSDSLKITKNKSYFIKPKHSKLSRHCTHLTGITDDVLEKHGTSLQTAINNFQKDFASKHKICASWGMNDKHILDKYCNKYKIKSPLSINYIDVQLLSGTVLNIGHNPNLRSAMIKYNINQIGPAHDAKHDAYNTAQILIEIFRRCRSTHFINLI